MYLDSHEREDVYATLWTYYNRQFSRRLEQSQRVEKISAYILLALVLAEMILAVLEPIHVAAEFLIVPVLAAIVVIVLRELYFQRFVMPLLSSGMIPQRMQEIEEAEVPFEERELFVEICVELQENNFRAVRYMLAQLRATEEVKKLGFVQDLLSGGL